MLEIAPARAAVVRCFGEARILDAFPSLGAIAGRVAPDELWLVMPPAAVPEVVRAASAHLASADPGGLVVEHGEAWVAWSITGPGTRAAFARLADFSPPAGERGFLQGLFGQVPAKILVQPGHWYVIVPVQVGHHIPGRMMEACADLGIRLGEERDMVMDAGGQR